LAYTPLTVDARNVQRLLSTVKRPEAYRQTFALTSYWPGGEETVTHDWARRGGMTRVEMQRPGHPAQNLIITEGLVYVWTGDTIAPHIVSPGDTDAEALSGIPTWEDIAAFPPESIVFAEYIFLPAERERCLRVKTQESVYHGEYILSLETGLLLLASFTDAEGNPAYKVAAGPPVHGDPGDESFTLPDGRLVE
jgi:hypothetical protein